ncbi:MAG: M48 family metallopeptidase, partial [Oscillospiraceae bacterium]
YAHFVHANHGRDFHALMQRLMPDYKVRKALLK